LKRISLSVTESASVDRASWPVTQGVPFADGELALNEQIRLVDANGVVLPLQTECLATWAADRRWVKWLLVDFQVDIAAGIERQLFLEFGDGVEVSPPHGAPVGVEEKGKTLTVETGPVQLTLVRDSATPVAALLLREDGVECDLLGTSGHDGTGFDLYLRDQVDVDWRSSLGPMPTIEIETAGPLRVAVCIRGHHGEASGKTMSPYALRLEMFAGRSEIRFAHTFVFDADPEAVELQRLGVDVGLQLGSVQRFGFGAVGESAQDGTGCSAGAGVEVSTGARFVQVSDEEAVIYHTDGVSEPPIDGSNGVDDHTRRETGQSVGRTKGWSQIVGDKATATLVVADMWREYPKAVDLTSNGFDLQIWPQDAGPLSFATPFKETAVRFARTRDEAEFRRIVEENPTAPLNLKSLAATTPEEIEWVEEMVARYAPDRPASYNDTHTDNGRGAARTTRFVLRLDGHAETITAEPFAAAVQEPLLAVVDSEYASATKAARVFAAADTQRFPVAEAGLEQLFERVVAEPRRILRTYGMIDYGDLMCSHSGTNAALWDVVRDLPDAIERMKYCARSYNNEANDQVLALWGFFLHSGDRQHFIAADAYGRHMADIDIIHAHTEPSHVGTMHYHNCHHWTGGPSPSHTCIAGLMLQYYQTGNRRIFDVCREVADWALSQQEPCGILANRSAALVREYTSPLANLLEFYQATWDERYVELAQRSLKWLLLVMPEPGCFMQSVFTAGEEGDEAEVEQAGWHLRQAGGMTPQLLYDAVQLFGVSDPIYRQALLAIADRYVYHVNDLFEVLDVDGNEQLDPYFNAAIIAYAYELTGQLDYAAYCRYYLREHFPARAQVMSFTYVCWGSIIPPMMAAVRHAEDQHGVQALENAEAAWVDRVRQRQQEPATSATVRPERRSIGRISGYDT
jgi:hypothetical protein